MNTKSKTTKTLQIITGVGAVLYLVVIAMSLFFDDLSFSTLTDYLTFVFLFVFMTIFALSWTRQKMAGILFMIWNVGVWIFELSLTIVGENEGSASMMASLVMVIGALFLLEWYKTSKATVPSEQQQWKFILPILLINYAVLYGIVVLSELHHGETVDYFSSPFIIYPLLLLIFLVGFVLSWKREFIAGFIFLFWYGILIYSNIPYSEIDRWEWAAFGLPILLQGIFYIKNHYKFRPK